VTVPANRLKVITPRRAIKNYQVSGLINLRYVALRPDPMVDAAGYRPGRSLAP
jgi:hypothetical protein